MMKLNSTLISIILLLPALLFSQNKAAEITGFYSDGLSQFARTDLQINEDGSFMIRRPLLDVDAYMERSESSGQWTSTGNKVILNPHLEPRKKQVWMEEKVIPSQDNISIRVHYKRQLYEQEQLVEEGPYPFTRMTILSIKNGNAIICFANMNTALVALRQGLKIKPSLIRPILSSSPRLKSLNWA